MAKRKIYIVAPDTEITDEIKEEASRLEAGEIVKGLPPALMDEIPDPVYPIFYIESVENAGTDITIEIEAIKARLDSQEARLNGYLEYIQELVKATGINPVDLELTSIGERNREP
jgi:hypothetical protein